MAYMSQESKKVIAANLKKIMPKSWKYSLSVRNLSEIVMTITQAPVDVIAEINAQNKLDTERTGMPFYERKGDVQINNYHFEHHFPEDSAALPVIREAMKALYSADYFDDSDSQTDYSHCAYYVDLHIGRWNKPFIVV